MNIQLTFENNQIRSKTPLKTSNSDILEIFSDINIHEHQRIVEDLWLTIDEEWDWITTKEFIHFTRDNKTIEKILDMNTLCSLDSHENLSGIYALNLWKYLYYGNPSELMWALSSYSDQGIIFTSPSEKHQRFHSKSESKILWGSINIVPIEVIDAWEFFRRYWYNEKYVKWFGATIEAWKLVV